MTNLQETADVIRRATELGCVYLMLLMHMLMEKLGKLLATFASRLSPLAF